MNLQDIEERMMKIQKEYSNTRVPKKYMRDTEYVMLKNKKRKIIEEEKDEQKRKKELELIRKDKQQSFNELPEEAKKLLSNHNYDIFRDPDNILNFNPCKDTPLANKIMNIRLPSLQQKL